MPTPKPNDPEVSLLVKGGLDLTRQRKIRLNCVRENILPLTTQPELVVVRGEQIRRITLILRGQNIAKFDTVVPYKMVDIGLLISLRAL